MYGNGNVHDSEALDVTAKFNFKILLFVID